jgi:alginate O-acetyltransferase complex protein AlgI
LHFRVESAAEKYLRWIPNWLGAITGGALTFIAVVAAWVVFRADSIAQASVMLQAMFGLHYRAISFDAVLHGNLLLLTDLSGRDLLKILLPSLLWVWLLPNSTRLRFVASNAFYTLLQLALLLTMLFIAIDHFGFYSPFLYFQF